MVRGKIGTSRDKDFKSFAVISLDLYLCLVEKNKLLKCLTLAILKSLKCVISQKKAKVLHSFFLFFIFYFFYFFLSVLNFVTKDRPMGVALPLDQLNHFAVETL